MAAGPVGRDSTAHADSKLAEEMLRVAGRAAYHQSPEGTSMKNADAGRMLELLKK